jgi:hypothetical protein
MFPEKLPGPGGIASLGVAWEQGQELPIGFTKKVIGFPRVANNCASCHTASYRKNPNEHPTFVPAGPSHTLNLEAFFRFVVDCARACLNASSNSPGSIARIFPSGAGGGMTR